MPRILSITWLAAALALSGCSDDTAPRTPAVDRANHYAGEPPCVLITGADFEAIVGNPVVATAMPGPSDVGCKYQPENPALVGGSLVVLWNGVAHVCDEYGARGIEPISGMGETAYVMSQAGGLRATASLIGCVGNITVSVGLAGNSSEDEMRRAAESLGRLALARVSPPD